jgi:hypothetical protein
MMKMIFLIFYYFLKYISRLYYSKYVIILQETKEQKINIFFFPKINIGVVYYLS